MSGFCGRSPDAVGYLEGHAEGRYVILLLGGDKSGHWSEWYKTAIPTADELYDTHLEELKAEGLLDRPFDQEDT